MFLSWADTKISGGTLNYEGITILNNAIAASYKGDINRAWTRLLCTPACLKWVAIKLEAEGQRIFPFNWYMIPFGEAIEFDNSKSVRLIIDAVGLLDIRKCRSINLRTSIEAARLTKKNCHTSAGVKMTVLGGFSHAGTQLCDMQSQNFIFLLKIVLTKETSHSNVLMMYFHFFD